ncbi:MAG TPA: transposase [Bacteroidales bacterium]|nr:transposase [Bacteroidales bacterium]
MIHVGIDLHTRNMVNVAINDNAEMVRQAKMPACPNSLDTFFGKFQEPVQAVVECTSSWYWLSDWFRDHQIPLKLAHAKMVKAISYAKVKTDKVDAKTLAELLRVGLIPEAYQIRADQRELRELTRPESFRDTHDPAPGETPILPMESGHQV